MATPASSPDDTLRRLDERRDALLAALKASRANGRVVLYLDLRGGEVVAGGELRDVEESWASRWD